MAGFQAYCDSRCQFDATSGSMVSFINSFQSSEIILWLFFSLYSHVWDLFAELTFFIFGPLKFLLEIPLSFLCRNSDDRNVFESYYSMAGNGEGEWISDDHRMERCHSLCGLGCSGFQYRRDADGNGECQLYSGAFDFRPSEDNEDGYAYWICAINTIDCIQFPKGLLKCCFIADLAYRIDAKSEILCVVHIETNPSQLAPIMYATVTLIATRLIVNVKAYRTAAHFVISHNLCR